MKEVIIATKNPGKVQEFKSELNRIMPNMKISSLIDMQDIPEIQETGKTFIQNAEIKARKIMQFFNKAVIADDSGLCVDALNGEPGIYSARYAGDHDDKANLAKLEHKLVNVPLDKRTAHFTTAIVLIEPNKKPIIVEGKTEGFILDHQVGENGFGYDPVFFYPPLKKTFAQLSTTEKNAVSHRGKAIKKLIKILEETK